MSPDRTKRYSLKDVEKIVVAICGQDEENNFLRMFSATPDGKISVKDLNPAFYDRNPLVKNNIWVSSVAAHASTVRWSYTVPTDRKAYVSLAHGKINATFGAGKKASIGVTLNGDNLFLYGVDDVIAGAFNSDSRFLGLYSLEGDVWEGNTFHNDGAAHAMKIGLVCLEFDA